MRLELSAQASRDIERLHRDGVARFGTRTAADYIKGLLDLLDLIGRNPMMARDRMEFHPPARLIRYKSHVVFYRIADERIKIVRVLHGRQDWFDYL